MSDLQARPDWHVAILELGIVKRLADDSGLIWLHFTDAELLQVNINRLIEYGLLKRVDTSYKPDGTWKDYFPPTAYAPADRAGAETEAT